MYTMLCIWLCYFYRITGSNQPVVNGVDAAVNAYLSAYNSLTEEAEQTFLIAKM